jgi:multidrug transporter EmrE-like cation transporter
MSFDQSYLIIAVIFNAVASICFKYSSMGNHSRHSNFIFFVSGLLFGGVNAFLYAKSLKTIELNVAYPIFSVGSFVLITIISLFLFNETLSFQKLSGIVVICIGIFLITY